jgi:hypothetical protein
MHAHKSCVLNNGNQFVAAKSDANSITHVSCAEKNMFLLSPSKALESLVVSPPISTVIPRILFAMGSPPELWIYAIDFFRIIRYNEKKAKEPFKMKILYCNVTEMNEYNGVANDEYHGGGSYCKENVPLEVNNFTSHNGKYYGFVQSTNDTIDISRNFGAPKDAVSTDGVLVVWVCNQSKIVGFYKNATVFRKKQPFTDSIASERVKVENAGYNITSDEVILIPTDKRTHHLTRKMGECNIWYGDEKNNRIVQDLFSQYESDLASCIQAVEDFSQELVGADIECLVKQRLNQGIFREQLLKRFNCKCTLCGVSNELFLIASHIKPWAKSDCNEKLSKHNGLLLCPNHDKLFDKGFISFTDDGKIIISHQLSENDKMFLNITPQMRIKEEFMSKEMKIYMEYHRTHIFKD